MAGIKLGRVKSLHAIRRLTESYAVARIIRHIFRHELRQVDAILDELDTLDAPGDINRCNVLTF